MLCLLPRLLLIAMTTVEEENIYVKKQEKKIQEKPVSLRILKTNPSHVRSPAVVSGHRKMPWELRS